VPVISGLTCAAVFGYMIIAEGWSGRARVGAFTVLDESEKRATTLGRTAYYSPVTPGEGLHFSQDTEITPQGLDYGDSGGMVCSLDWTHDQHLNRGWGAARVPAPFKIKSEPRRERLAVSQEGGTVSVTNQLGADIKSLWLADDKGQVFVGENIRAGQQTSLKRAPGGLAVKATTNSYRGLLANPEWGKLADSLPRKPENLLTPRTYLAVLESSPFLEKGLEGAHLRQAEAAVLGLMADPE